MKVTNLRTMILIIAVIFQSCNSTNKAENINDSTKADYTNVDTSDKVKSSATTEDGIQGVMFIEKAAQRGQFEVELGKLASEKSQNKRIKNFGKLMETDHTEMNVSLKALASIKGLKLPASLPEEDLKQIRDMGRMEKDYFERLYIKVMVDEHSKDLELFQGAQKSADTVISNFASKYLPVLKKHYKMAMEAAWEKK